MILALLIVAYGQFLIFRISFSKLAATSFCFGSKTALASLVPNSITIKSLLLLILPCPYNRIIFECFNRCIIEIYSIVIGRFFTGEFLSIIITSRITISSLLDDIIFTATSCVVFFNRSIVHIARITTPNDPFPSRSFILISVTLIDFKS